MADARSRTRSGGDGPRALRAPSRCGARKASSSDGRTAQTSTSNRASRISSPGSTPKPRASRSPPPRGCSMSSSRSGSSSPAQGRRAISPHGTGLAERSRPSCTSPSARSTAKQHDARTRCLQGMPKRENRAQRAQRATSQVKEGLQRSGTAHRPRTPGTGTAHTRRRQSRLCADPVGAVRGSPRAFRTVGRRIHVP